MRFFRFANVLCYTFWKHTFQFIEKCFFLLHQSLFTKVTQFGGKCFIHNFSRLFSFSSDSSEISCGATIVNDRFVIFAAHCTSFFQRWVKGGIDRPITALALKVKNKARRKYKYISTITRIFQDWSWVHTTDKLSLNLWPIL